MLKNFKSFNKNLLNKMIGPTEDEVWDTLKDYDTNNMYAKSCEAGFLKGVKLALEKGVDIFTYFQYDDEDDYGEHMNETGNSALEHLIKNNDYEIFKYVFDNTSIKGHHYENIMNLLELSAYYNRIEFAKICIENGGNINDKYFSVLPNAVDQQHYDMVKFLLENGADVNIGNNYCIKKSIKLDNTMLTNLLKEYSWI